MLSRITTSHLLSRRQALWPISLKLQYAFQPVVAEAMHAAGKRLELPGTAVDVLAFVLGNFDVVPLSAELIWQRMPYKSLSIYRRMVSTLVLHGLLHQSDRYGYFLTEKARTLGWQLFAAKHERLRQIGGLSAREQFELATLLHRLQHQARVMPGLPDRRWLMSRNAYLQHDAAPMARVEAYLADLNAYRDDCYLYAWQPLGVSGQVWEVLNLLWKYGSQSLVQVQERLHGRGYSATEFEQALADLQARRWVSVSGSADTAVYAITVAGRQLCQQVETETDQHFYAPWTVLSDGDLFRLESLTVYLAAHVNGRQSFMPI